MTELIRALSALTPLGLAGMLAVIIFLQVRNQRKLTSNHLHDLPDMVASLSRIEGLLQDINANVIWLRARSNGK